MEQISLYEKTCDLGITLVFWGLKQCGSSWTMGKICQSIEEKSESFKDFLLTLNTYGMYDMLVAIYEIVNLFCATDIQNWFHEQLRQCPDRDVILRMSNKFYQKRMADLQGFNELKKKLDVSFDECQNESKKILGVNLSQFESYIWESYDFDFLRKITRNNLRNVGVWFPMIYKKSNIEKYANKLDEYAFPCLIMCMLR